MISLRIIRLLDYRKQTVLNYSVVVKDLRLKDEDKDKDLGRH